MTKNRKQLEKALKRAKSIYTIIALLEELQKGDKSWIKLSIRGQGIN